MASLSSLDYDFRPYAEGFFQFAKSIDNRFVITSARRSWFEQARLYANYLYCKAYGTTAAELAKPGEGLTGMPINLPAFKAPCLPAARPGTSMHEKGLAFDMARLSIEAWSDEYLPALGAIWNDMGGTWRASDPVHFEAS